MKDKRLVILLFGVLLAAGIGIAALGFYMPELRQKYVYAPQQARAEAAIRSIAAGEKAVRRRSGKFEIFAPADFSSRARALGLNWNEMPSDNFQFDSVAAPGGRLRLRA